jgi:hypothetical protein
MEYYESKNSIQCYDSLNTEKDAKNKSLESQTANHKVN